MSTTHRIQDHHGTWHNVGKSTGKPGAYVSYKTTGVPERLWMPGQFNSKTVQVLPL